MNGPIAVGDSTPALSLWTNMGQRLEEKSNKFCMFSNYIARRLAVLTSRQHRVFVTAWCVKSLDVFIFEIYVVNPFFHCHQLNCPSQKE